MIDSHIHLDDDRYQVEDMAKIVQDAKDAGVNKMINISVQPDRMKIVVDQAEKFDGVYATVGVHPHYAKLVDEKVINEMRELTKNKKVVAIGEIGLDYHYDERDSNEVQEKAFRMQLDLARELNLSVVIHSRDAWEDTHNILKDYTDVTILMHCYAYSKEIMDKYIELGCYFSFGGPVTFKNAMKPKEAATHCPIDRLMCETDCPWLTPVPFRGKTNYPAYVAHVYKCISDLRGEDITAAVEQNVRKVFGI